MPAAGEPTKQFDHIWSRDNGRPPPSQGSANTAGRPGARKLNSNGQSVHMCVLLQTNAPNMLYVLPQLQSRAIAVFRAMVTPRLQGRIVDITTQVNGKHNGTVSAVIPVVGIGASAGGLDVFKRLLGDLPCDTGLRSYLCSIWIRITIACLPRFLREPPLCR